MVAIALSARQHGVVVMHQCCTRLSVIEQIAVDRAHAGNNPVPFTIAALLRLMIPHRVSPETLERLNAND